MIHKGVYKKIGEWVNSRLEESLSDLNRVKIRLGKFKAVYSFNILQKSRDMLCFKTLLIAITDKQ